MRGLVNYLEDMYKECQIPFVVYIDNEKIFQADSYSPKNGVVENRILLGSKECTIQLEEENKKFIKIFRFCIENFYKEDYDANEKTIIELLKKSCLSKERIEKTLPSPSDDSYLITICLKDKIQEALSILKSVYNDNIAIVKYEDSIVLLGEFEDIVEHISSISETLDVSIYERCYIAYCHITDYEKLGSLYDDSINNIILAKRYNLSTRIFDENSLLFEKIMNTLDDKSKKDIMSKFSDGFSKLDEDLVKTIEVFFNLDLNLSEASKELYVHRNTLIYRLDKIQKCTSYDIRKFKDAVLFKIAFFIWREKK